MHLEQVINLPNIYDKLLKEIVRYDDTDDTNDDIDDDDDTSDGDDSVYDDYYYLIFFLFNSITSKAT